MKCERSTADGVPDVGRAAGPRVEECGAVQGVAPWAAGTLTPAPRNTSAARRRRTAKIRRRSGDRGPGAISGRRAEPLQVAVDGEEERLPRPACGEMKPPPPHRADDAGAELEEAEPHGAERCPGECRARQDAQPEELEQVVGERVQEQAKGVGAEGVTGEPIGGEVALELLDEVLRLAPLVVPGEDVRRPAAAVGDDEADV